MTVGQESLLRVRDLNVRYDAEAAPALDHVSFALAAGESIGLLGESGAGKTTLARTLLGLLPAGRHVCTGSIQFLGTELLRARETEWRTLRGAQISLVSQEPELALNPVMQVGKQVDEVLRAHSHWNRDRRRREVQAILAQVGLPDRNTYAAFPHELSGGQRQRIVIAQALIAKPRLLIADEPTSALDTVTQAGVLELLKKLKNELRLSLLFITHNPALLDGLVERVVVLSRGRVVEMGPLEWSSGGYRDLLQRKTSASQRTRQHADTAAPLLKAHQISKFYRRGRWPGPNHQIAAIDGVDLELLPGCTLALVGRSGSGKSTLARCIAGLETPDRGEVWLQGKNLFGLRGRELRQARRDIQIVFQHSAAAMNSSFTALDAVAEPLRIQGFGRKQRYKEAGAVMEQLGLRVESAKRSPLEFSGGQRQRLALARALITKPKILILDEALAGLDSSMQLQIANLLLELQSSRGLAYLFISHDLHLAARMADTVAVLDQGRMVETGRAMDVYANPQSAPARELVAAVPELLKHAGDVSDPF